MPGEHVVGYDPAGSPRRAPGVYSTAMCFTPPMKFERRISGSATRCMSGMRDSTSSKISLSYMRARLAPRQKWWPPPPKATCSSGSRVMSNRNGSSNTDSSRFAEMYHITTLSPSPIS